MSDFHAPCAKLVLLTKLYREDIKRTICQLSKSQCHSLTLAFTLPFLLAELQEPAFPCCLSERAFSRGHLQP